MSEKIKYTNTKKVLDTFGTKVVQQARRILKAKGKNASGNLSNSLGYQLKVYDSGAIDMNFIALGYANIVDKGVKGSSGKAHPKKGKVLAPFSPYRFRGGKRFANIGAIDKWVVRKGLKAGRNDKGQFVKRKSLVRAIARSIYLYGIEPTNFITDAFKINFKKLPNEFTRAYAKDVNKFLTFVTKEM
jgi:hypothetical protein